MKKVITYGTFDLFHAGHENLLRRAKALGDYLVVGVTSENYDRYRGKLNVQQTLLERIENVRKTELADEIVVEEYEGQKIDDITRMGINVFAIGSDWVGRFDLNAVYIASPHETHYEYARQALLAGKHVLCEKPMVFSVREAKELFALAKSQRLVLLEALKTAYCPGFQRLISCAKSGKIGRIVSVDAAFTKLVPSNVREMQDNGAGGSVAELASYPLLAILKLLGGEWREMRFTSYAPTVDLFTRIDLWYPNAIASAKVGLGVKSEGSFVISGTRGYIYVPAPWWKTEYFELRYENPSDAEKHFYKFSGDGLRYEIVEFLNRITAGQMDEGACALSCDLARVLECYR